MKNVLYNREQWRESAANWAERGGQNHFGKIDRYRIASEDLTRPIIKDTKNVDRRVLMYDVHIEININK